MGQGERVAREFSSRHDLTLLVKTAFMSTRLVELAHTSQE